MNDLELRQICGPEDEAGYAGCMGAAFGGHVPLDLLTDELAAIGRERTLIARDGGQVVGTAAWFPLELTVPGGGHVAGGGVTSVTTLPTHRRRGVLTSMMRRQLSDLAAAGLPCALLTASEGGIYGRFGYGVATYKCRYKVDKQTTRLRPEALELAAAGRVRLASTEEAAKAIPEVWERARHLRAGEISYPAPFWAQHFRPQPKWRDVDNDRRFFALYEQGGEVLGGVDYQVAGRPGGREVDVDLLISVTRPAYAALWNYLLGIDLTPTVMTRQRPIDEPLRHLVTDPRRLEMSSYQDSLWVRPLDAVKLLESRRYAPGCAGRLTLDVHDTLLPQVAGGFELEIDSAGTPEVTRLSDQVSGTADLQLDVGQLGSMLLGGVSLASLRDAGIVGSTSADAAWRADAMFCTDVPPFLTLGF